MKNPSALQQIACIIFLLIPQVLLFASAGAPPGKGAYYSGEYPNLFTELLGRSQGEVQAKVDAAWAQLFLGNDSTQRIFYPVEPDMGYIEDVLHRDVRSEGQSYGMMTAVQLDKKAEFNRMWKWAKTFMQHQQGQRKGFFAWQVNPNGTVMDPNSAADGEEWFVTALFLASARWGDGTGITNYRAEAQAILDAMLGKLESSDNDTTVTNMFNKIEKQIVFVPVGNADDFTDPSYHLPHFYELWAQRADKDNDFWREAAGVSRGFLKKTVHPKTGLAPDYAHFDGRPTDMFNGGHADFRFDAWRVAANVATDYVWFAKDDWAVAQSNRLLDFFTREGVGKSANQYTLDGTRLSGQHSTGLDAVNAAACLASTNPNRKEFVQVLWDMPIPDGLYRYYDGMLYMMSLLQVSGNFRAYHPAEGSVR